MTILDSYHQGQHSDKIRFLIDQRILSRDGFELSADVVLPDESGPFPTVYLRTPYESSSQKSLERGVWWAKRGYAFVSGDCLVPIVLYTPSRRVSAQQVPGPC